ncbi:MAG: recombinase family protein, partial [Cyanobacteria bacterium J06649_5]
KIFSDRGMSGAKAERPGLDKALEHIRQKDTLVIWKLDRLGRSLSDLLSIVEYLKERGANFLSIQDGFDTSTASGKMVFSVIGAMAEYGGFCTTPQKGIVHSATSKTHVFSSDGMLLMVAQFAAPQS